MGPCTHPRTEKRRKAQPNGRYAVALQCLHCGVQVRRVAQKHLRPYEYALLPDWDEGLVARHRESLRAARAEGREVGRSEQKAFYHDYLKSDRWKAKRKVRLATDGGLCQAKLDRCQRFATEVHHLTYDHVGNEPLWDLVSVCRNCHGQLTAMDAKRRGKGW